MVIYDSLVVATLCGVDESKRGYFCHPATYYSHLLMLDGQTVIKPTSMCVGFQFVCIGKIQIESYIVISRDPEIPTLLKFFRSLDLP